MSERYLDAAATSPLRPEAFEAMRAVYEQGQANPSSVHAPGHRAEAVVRRAREEIAATFGVRPPDVVFTSGGTEANNLAIIGLALANPRGRHLITTPVEHPSVLESCRYLERVFGFDLTIVPVDAAGRVAPEHIASALRDDTSLVTVGLANGEVGTVQPVPEIADLVHGSGALMHTDAVQAVASLPVSFDGEDPRAWPGRIDAASIVAHKLGGPQGAGALLVRRDLALEPVLHGGGQERGLRSGTENVAAIAGFAAAARATAVGIGGRALELMRTRDVLVERLTSALPGASLTGHESERLPGHASFVVGGHSGESMLVALDAAGVAVSSGSACAAGRDAPSPALLAMGIDADLARTALRFTLPEPISDDLIARIVDVLVTEAGRRVLA